MRTIRQGRMLVERQGDEWYKLKNGPTCATTKRNTRAEEVEEHDSF